jgi:hypothetical protein
MQPIACPGAKIQKCELSTAKKGKREIEKQIKRKFQEKAATTGLCGTDAATYRRIGCGTLIFCISI